MNNADKNKNLENEVYFLLEYYWREYEPNRFGNATFVQTC